MTPENNNTLLQKIRLLADTRIIGLLIFAAIALLITWSGLKVIKTNYELEKEISKLEQQNAVQELENANMKLRNEYYNSTTYLELEARRQFNKAAAGEKLYLIPDDVALAYTVDYKPLKPRTREEGEAAKPKYRQNLEAWVKFFFNRGY